ncbi:MAG: hypothetical protein F6K48_31715 [Okeania sp. SIO3H1]|nr:hypothetical protein [Okeania sp. SIO3H1]
MIKIITTNYRVAILPEPIFTPNYKTKMIFNIRVRKSLPYLQIKQISPYFLLSLLPIGNSIEVERSRN